MEFSYIKIESDRRGTLRPFLPITLTYRGRELPIGHALVDTGSDLTILPLEIAHLLEIELDDSERTVVSSAGGGQFTAMPCRRPIGFSIERAGFRAIRWEGIAYFAENEPIILLGHQGCLEKFDLTFRGPEKVLQVLPRFKV